MELDPAAPLVRYRRYLISWGTRAYQVDTPDEWLADLDPAYATAQPAAALALRRRLAADFARQFALQLEYDRAAGRYAGPDLRVVVDRDPPAPATEDDYTVILHTGSAAALLDDLARGGLVQWLDLDQVPGIAAPDPAEEEPSMDATMSLPQSPQGPWVFANPSAAAPADLAPIEAWLATHGGPLSLRYELIFDGGNQRGYGRDWTDLCALLLPAYLAGDTAARTAARLAYSTHVAVAIQVAVLQSLSPSARGACTAAEWAALTGTRALPLAWSTWSAPVPLVLPTWQYAPTTAVPPPVSAPRDGRPAGSNLWWIDPSSDERLIQSLAALGWVGLASADPDPPGDPDHAA